MRTRPAALALGLAASVATAGCSVLGYQAAPEPDYEVVVSDPPFEIRRYPPLAVARTTATGGYDSAVRTGFGRLFDYISGENAGEKEIAMTAPVMTEPEAGEGAEIAMTAPVLTEAAGDGTWTTMFVLPEGYTAGTAPEPTNAEVTIDTIPERRVAAVTFSWFFSQEAIAENRARLADWIEAQGETPAGDWQGAGYNPPWTLPWLRRNEVLVTLE